VSKSDVYGVGRRARQEVEKSSPGPAGCPRRSAEPAWIRRLDSAAQDQKRREWRRSAEHGGDEARPIFGQSGIRVVSVKEARPGAKRDGARDRRGDEKARGAHPRRSRAKDEPAEHDRRQRPAVCESHGEDERSCIRMCNPSHDLEDRDANRERESCEPRAEPPPLGAGGRWSVRRGVQNSFLQGDYGRCSLDVTHDALS
jgi:hypothetical protein